MGAAGALFAAAVFAVGSDSFVGTDGSAHHPFASAARARIFLFARTDCPITNRYAPELQRISKEFASTKASISGWSIPTGATAKFVSMSRNIPFWNGVA